MGEWLKPAVLKTVSGETRSGVRIPLPPPRYLLSLQSLGDCRTNPCAQIVPQLPIIPMFSVSYS
jgi:hypothetical protein